ncbi:MAG: magnesium transporter [Chthoniobacterales bacterium]
MRQDPDFSDPITAHTRSEFPLLQTGMSVAEALEKIRREGASERIIYFYVVDADSKLAGVLPTRRLLTAAVETSVGEIMVPRVIALPASATVLDACEFFVLYKFFAFPVVDSERRVIGVVDVGLFAEELLGAEEAAAPAADIFEVVGFRLAQIRGASPWQAFRYRFPWLIVTIATGTICAFLAGAFEGTLARSLVIAFFLTMVLGLNESVSMQSMTLTVQLLRGVPVEFRWFWQALRREIANAALIGAASGILVAAVVWVWRRDVAGAVAIGSTLLVSLVSAALFGLAVPSLLHRLRLDPKIAAGPVTLAVTDVTALTFYFTICRLMLE